MSGQNLAVTSTADIPGLKMRQRPINLRQSGDEKIELLLSTRVHKSPLWHLSVAAGCWRATVYNGYHPRGYEPYDPEHPLDSGVMLEDDHLNDPDGGAIWDVGGAEEQIRVIGPDAAKFVNAVITRVVPEVDKSKYVFLCTKDGVVYNDPLLLRLAPTEFWFSISDGDVLQALRMFNWDGRYNVEINKIDVAPVQIQGARTAGFMEQIFGPSIRTMERWDVRKEKLVTSHNVFDVVVSRSGFSGVVGMEIYPRDATTIDIDDFYGYLRKIGEEHNFKITAPGHPQRIAVGIYSLGQDMDGDEDNAFETGLWWQITDQYGNFLKKTDYVGKAAFAEILEKGRAALGPLGPQDQPPHIDEILAAVLKEKTVGLLMGGTPIADYPKDFYVVFDQRGKVPIGYITSAFWSKALETNIAFARMAIGLTKPGTKVKVVLPQDAEMVDAMVHTSTRFVDPTQKIVSQDLRRPADVSAPE